MGLALIARAHIDAPGNHREDTIALDPLKRKTMSAFKVLRRGFWPTDPKRTLLRQSHSVVVL